MPDLRIHFDIYSEWGRYSDALRWFSGPFGVSAYEALGLTERVDGILEVYAQEDPIGFNVTSYEEVDPDYLGYALITQVLAGEYDLAMSIFRSLADEDPALLVAEMFVRVGLDTQKVVTTTPTNPW